MLATHENHDAMGNQRRIGMGRLHHLLPEPCHAGEQRLKRGSHDVVYPGESAEFGFMQSTGGRSVTGDGDVLPLGKFSGSKGGTR